MIVQKAKRWGIIAIGILLLPLMRLSLRLLGYRRSRTGLLWFSPTPSLHSQHSEMALQRARRLAQYVNTASRRGFIRPTCLERSLLLWWWLRWMGIPTQICSGVRKYNSSVDAHAWLEYGGVVVNDRSDIAGQYMPLWDTITPDKIRLFR